MRLIYLSHPESEVDPLVAVPDWRLSARGVARATVLALRWPFGAGPIWTSPERKAQAFAAILGSVSGSAVQNLPESYEIDRSTTGFVPPARHDALAHQLFAQPNVSAEGWERAVDAQSRIVRAVAPLFGGPHETAIVIGHGGVGTLLWLHLTGQSIAPGADQPRQGCGWIFDLHQNQPVHGWRVIEAL